MYMDIHGDNDGGCACASCQASIYDGNVMEDALVLRARPLDFDVQDVFHGGDMDVDGR